MIRHKGFISILLVLFFASNSYSNHILGGEIAMNANDENGNFEIKLLQFWNKNHLIIPSKTNGGNRDDSADLYIYSKSSNKFISQATVKYIKTENIDYKNQACATYKSMETVLGTYSGVFFLDPRIYNEASGYYIVWERCCRNEDINNIKDPGGSGMVFYLEFPPVTTKNSSPQFLIPNGEYICVNKDFEMSMAATDVDGDELKYSMESPLKGYTSTTVTKGDNLPKNGYSKVVWGTGYGENNAINGANPLKIHQSNGQLSVNASALGLYVFTITCREFRNGKQIGLVRRDFQLLVIDCADDAPVIPQILIKQLAMDSTRICQFDTIKIETVDETNYAYQWQQNGKNISGANRATLMVSDTGYFHVIKSYANKCGRESLSTPLRVDYNGPIPMELISSKSILCKNDSVIIFDAKADPSIARLNTWYLDNVVIPNEIDSKILADKAGKYQLVTKNKNNSCNGRDTISIYKDNIVVNLPSEMNMQKGASLVLSPEINDMRVVDSFSWLVNEQIYDSSNWNLVVSPDDDTIYKLQVVTKINCIYEYVTKIRVIDNIYIPNIFTPNGDGINDYFEIKNIKSKILDVKIFNRWGELVFFSEGYDKLWDGKFKNNYLENGYYPYLINLVTKQKIQGQVLIVR